MMNESGEHQTKVFRFNGHTFMVSEIYNGLYTVTHEGVTFTYRSSPHIAHADVLFSGLDDLGKLEYIDHETANWPEPQIRRSEI